MAITPYATGNDLMLRKDARTLADLASDTGEPIEIGTIPSNSKIIAALADASGAFESALFKGGMYTADDLNDLDPDSNSAHLVRRIVCDLAMAFLWERRPKYDQDGYATALKIANEWIKRLANGEDVLAIQKVIDAGTPKSEGLHLSQYNRLNTIADRTRRYYYGRGQRLPTNRQD